MNKRRTRNQNQYQYQESDPALIEARNAAARYENHVADQLGFGRNTALPLFIAAPAPITWKSLDIPKPLSAVVTTFTRDEVCANKSRDGKDENGVFEMRASNLTTVPSEEKSYLLYSLGF